MHASEVTPEAARAANELYWGSDTSVNRIAEDLDLSKGALYGVIVPLPSGHFCPMCADEVAYANRTAKERDQLRCPTCDWEGGSEETVDYDDGETARGGATEDAGRPQESAPSGGPVRAGTRAQSGGQASARPSREETNLPTEPLSDDPLPPLLTPRARTIAGGALIGAAVGLALVLWARRR